MYSSDADPRVAKEPPRDLTEYGAGANLLKFLIGLGIISLPEATKHVGWLPSILGLAVVACVSVWGVLFAVQSSFKLDKLEKEARDANSARAMTEGDPLINQGGSWRDMPNSGCGFFDRVIGKVWGWPAQCFFAGTVALGQFTTLVIYLEVITTNFESYFTGAEDVHLPVLACIVVVLGIFSLIPTLQGIAVLSAAGLSIYTFIIVGLVTELFRKLNGGLMPQALMVKPFVGTEYGQWFGVACFAYAGLPICMVMYEEMRNPEKFQKVIVSAYTVCWIVYSIFAVIGFLCYGADTQVLVYFNFEQGSAFRNASAAALACILSFSFVVQAMPIFNCTARAWEWSGFDKKMGVTGLWTLAFVRWTVLALTVVVAYLIPSVKVLMNTFGAISGVVACFLFPAFTYLKLSSRDEWAARGRCILVVIIGVMGMCYSVFDSSRVKADL